MKIRKALAACAAVFMLSSFSLGRSVSAADYAVTYEEHDTLLLGSGMITVNKSQAITEDKEAEIITDDENEVTASDEKPEVITIEDETVFPTGIKFSDGNVTELKVGESTKLSARISPKNVTENKVKWSSSNTSVADVNKGKVIARSKGTAVITLETVNGLTAQCKITVKSNSISIKTEMRDSYMIKGFKPVMQNPELPTGCEITALTQTLNYYGYNITKTVMTDNYLKTSPVGSTNFYNAFMETPYSPESFGCYSPVIKNAANNYFGNHGNKHVALSYTGKDIETIYKIVNEGYPVIVWCTYDMEKPDYKYLWTTDKGEEVYWKTGEHCVTLIGFNNTKNTVILADPLRGLVAYNKDEFEACYKELGQQAIVIKPIEAAAQ